MKRACRVLSIALVAGTVGFGALSTATANATPERGVIFGVLTLRLMSPPVCVVGYPCSGEPLPNTVILFERSGRPAVPTRTNAAGEYRLRLSSGNYTIAVPNRGSVRPSTVYVSAGRSERLNLVIGTSIRNAG
jgi:uncharacterized membrane protein YtjA (UPF0391 family)